MDNVISSGNQFKDLLDRANRVLLLVRSNPSPDGLAAVKGLAQSIRDIGKEVIIASPEKITGEDSFVQTLGPRSFIISIPYTQGSIRKIHYGPEGGKFNLAITPGKGHRLTPEAVEFSYSGAEYDLVIAVDTPEPSILGTLYESEKEIWQNVPVVNLDRNPANTQYGQLNILATESSSTSEVTFRLLRAAGMPVRQGTSAVLLAGLTEATDKFSKATAADFETAADLSRISQSQERVETSEEKLVSAPFRKKEEYIELGAKLLG